MDFRPVEEGEAHSDSEGNHSEETKEADKIHARERIKAEQTAAGKKSFSGIFLTY